jgi:PEP-CTERM motif
MELSAPAVSRMGLDGAGLQDALNRDGELDMKFKKLLQVAGLVLPLSVGGLAANAITLTSGSNSASFSWSQNTADGLLQGTGTITVTGFNSGTLSVTLTLNNTSADSTDRLTAFGFGIDPNATAVSFSDAADGGMIDASLANIPSLSTIEVCAWGGQNCAGGSSGGILGGASDTFTLLLTGTWGSSVTFDPLGFKYQTSGQSYEFTSTSTSTTTTTTTTSGSTSGNAPEPGSTLTLLGLGLLGLGFSRRFKKAA